MKTITEVGIGKHYAVKNSGTRTIKRYFSYKKLRFGFLVYEINSSAQVLIVSTKLRAAYACARLNAVDMSNVFMFGDIL